MRQILLGGEVPPHDPSVAIEFGPWWNQYLNHLQSEREFHPDSPQLVELTESVKTTFASVPRPTEWGDDPCPFKGLVVGAVQSGKTANMIGLTAAALDLGYKIVIVLAGKTNDLRAQTSLRFNTQLLQRSDEIPGSHGQTTLGGPLRQGPLGGCSLPYPIDVADYGPLLASMDRALRAGEPCVITIKKKEKSLIHMASKIMRVLYERHGAAQLPTLVLDDECDEASVPGPGEPKVIPELIAALWKHKGLPMPPVAYVGYTATAAAALLQEPENDLYPSHFVQLLRYPAASDGPLSYSVPNTDDRYSGSVTFYEAFGDEAAEADNFLMSATVESDEINWAPEESPSLKDAVIAFFVSGGFRLALDPLRRFDNPSALPKPHSMIVQTSPQQDEHLRFWKAIQAIFGGTRDDAGHVVFHADHVSKMIADDAEQWQGWHGRFEASRQRLHATQPHRTPFQPVSWEDVLAKIPEAASNTKLKIVNSDEHGQSLSYQQPLGRDGSKGLPEDVYVIAVGGAILSRGLTIEGLCISYYTRTVDRPLEDATLQMSRWFGYRGTHLEFCRVFTTQDSYVRLKSFHENDLQHRNRLAMLMEQHARVDEARIALRAAPSALLTAKIGVGQRHNIAFSPYSHVFDRLEIGDLAEQNEQLALRILHGIRSRGAEEIRVGQGSARGLLSRGWAAEEIARILDDWAFTKHNPDPQDYPYAEYHRPTDSSRATSRSLGTRNDPYLVAAYLRWWAENANETAPPRFNLGVTYGPWDSDCEPFDFPLLNRAITAEGAIEGGWSGASSGWRGDKFFDAVDADLVDLAGERKVGVDGLLLVHVVHKLALGRSQTGHVRSHHTLTFGICVPAGGPAFSVVVNYDRR